ncbi:hypothetical protein HYV85_03705 [Candidatus Woesearchaeota archaeon]|nr:hypothetical protein [Candidatus Woesearchaeota archaeon]
MQHDLFTETKSSMTTGPIASAMWKGQSKSQSKNEQETAEEKAFKDFYY